MKHREATPRIRRLIVAGTITVMIAAAMSCSHKGTTDGRTAATHSVSSAASPTSLAQETVTHLPPAPPPPPAPMHLDEDTWNPFGHFLIGLGGIKMVGDFSAGYIPQNPSEVSTGLEFLHPKWGRFKLPKDLLGKPATDPAGEVTGVLFASSGSVDAPYIAGIVTVREPSHDLVPASTVEYAVRIDPGAISQIKKAEIGRHPDGTPYERIDKLVGSPGETIAWSAGSTTTVGFDLATMKQTWTHPGGIYSAVFDSGGVLIRQHISCEVYSAVDVATGAEIFVADGRALATTHENCANLHEVVFPTAGIVGVWMSNHDGRKPFDGYDFVHHTKVIIGPETKWADPRSSLIGADTDGKSYVYETRDRNTGQTLFTMPEDKGNALQFRVTQLFNKQLFVETTNEKLVVDAATGATVSRGWTSYPVDVADDWVLYSDGTFAKQ